MPEKPSTVAVIALCLSIGSACFSIFQWWSNERQKKIDIAIDISKKYIQDRELEKGHLQVESSYLAKKTSDIPSGEEAYPAGVYLKYLEYVAFLANSDKLDEAYLSRALKCDIKITFRTLRFVQAAFGIDFNLPEIERFALRDQSHKQWIDCSGYQR